MKVLFCISVLSGGKGGHYHSLHHISGAISQESEVGVISIGPRESSITSSNRFFLKHIHFNGFSMIGLIMELSKVLGIFKPDIIHCFDPQSFQVLKFFLGKSKVIILTQCGGPNPIQYPRVEDLVLFSNENKSWFNSKSKFLNSRIYLIPNRVIKLIVKKVDGIEKDENAFTFMRIARIGKVYFKSFRDSIRMVDFFFEKGYNVKLVIVGSIYEHEFHEKILQLSAGKAYIQIITDDSLTTEASKLLYLADAVIATGRGIMEATSLSIPVFTPASNSDYPILINRGNFENFFNTNFSQRNVASSVDLENNLKLAENLFSKGTFFKEISDFAFDMFKENFDLSTSFLKYSKVYKNAIQSKIEVGRFTDLKMRIRTLLSFFKASNRFVSYILGIGKKLSSSE